MCIANWLFVVSLFCKLSGIPGLAGLREWFECRLVGWFCLVLEAREREKGAHTSWGGRHWEGVLNV